MYFCKALWGSLERKALYKCFFIIIIIMLGRTNLVCVMVVEHVHGGKSSYVIKITFEYEQDQWKVFLPSGGKCLLSSVDSNGHFATTPHELIKMLHFNNKLVHIYIASNINYN